MVKQQEVEMVTVTKEGEIFEDIWNIYTRSFPKEEQREKKQHIEFLGMKDYKLFGFSQNGKVIGFLSCWFLSDEYFFIAHFAIHPECRASGFGTAVLQKLFSLKDTLDIQNVILEVDDPEFHKNKEICEKRIKFYKRNGLVLNESIKYSQPALNKRDKQDDDFNAPKLMLMSYQKEIENPNQLKQIIFNKYYKAH
eukprot:gene8001-12466_t